MKSVFFFLAVFIVASMPLSQAGTVDDSKKAALIKQACKIGSEDEKNGHGMDSSTISIKNSSGKYIALETQIRKEYEKCYRQEYSITAKTSVPSIKKNTSDSNPLTLTKDQSGIGIVSNEDYSKIQPDGTGLKLSPHTSEVPFAWFHDWVAAVEEAPDHYAKEKKHAEDLKKKFIKSCQKSYSIGNDNSELIQRWCIITGWENFQLDLSATYDDSFKYQLEEMQVQIGYSELSYSKNGDRDVKNAFDRAKGDALDYKMTIIEETKVMPYLLGINVALANIEATNIAMKSLDEKLISERKNKYLAELKMRENKRIAEEKKRLQQQQHQRYLTQKKQADALSGVACKKARKDAVKLKKLQPDQYTSEAKALDLIDGVEDLIAARFTGCYDAQLLSLTCKKAGDDYMKCLDEGPAEKYVSLASKKLSVDAFKTEYKKCQNERKDLYLSEIIKKKNTHKKLLRYAEIYRESGGYFINDYNECVTSLISVMNNVPDKLQFSGVSVNKVRSCENISRMLEKYASQSCACKYGVVVDTLNSTQFTGLSDDILTLIKLSHSDIESNHLSKSDGKNFMDSLVYPDEAVEIINKIASECVM